MRNRKKKKERERSCKEHPTYLKIKQQHIREPISQLKVCQIYVHCNFSQDLTPQIATLK